ncbi:hypothetical protein [Microbacterium caowuchunii]|uniref:Uncharacterized protein n=1 Tax=Microbacterium caowuchunii TaxID=2614638 RepID=A0A5N0TL16_9MICO|nr:hypothetical protein [Microbacterium caowuchunii]KAA9134827.1 hypothetical protein F6B40_03760 [Microbacterium caowuchunii]
MRDDIRSYLREHTRGSSEAAFFTNVPDIDDDLGDALLDAQVAAAERLNPSMKAQSLLLVRLAGEHIVDGWMDADLQNEILTPLVKEIELAAPRKAKRLARMGLVGVSSGSVVLHYRPLAEAGLSQDNQLAYEVHPADSAVLRVSELHDFFETEENPAVIASAFGQQRRLLRQSRLLVEALEKYSVNLSTRWWGPTSKRAVSRISERGRQHALKIFRAEEQDELIQLRGMVTALDIDGIVTVTDALRRRHRVTVDATLLQDERFTLGLTVFLEAREIQEVDGVGQNQGWNRYEFVRHLDQPTLDL